MARRLRSAPAHPRLLLLRSIVTRGGKIAAVYFRPRLPPDWEFAIHTWIFAWASSMKASARRIAPETCLSCTPNTAGIHIAHPRSHDSATRSIRSTAFENFQIELVSRCIQEMDFGVGIYNQSIHSAPLSSAA